MIKYPVGKYISIISRHGKKFFRDRFERFNIGSGQGIFLLHLYFRGGINQEELSNLLNIDKATTAKALKKLEKEGYITRVKDECDKRAYKLYVTEKAESIKKDVFLVLKEWNEHLTKGFTEEEHELAMDILIKMSKNAVNIMKDED